jgi:hypothetical protein
MSDGLPRWAHRSLPPAYGARLMARGRRRGPPVDYLDKPSVTPTPPRGQFPVSLDKAAAHQTAPRFVDQVHSHWPKLAALLGESEHDVLALMASPAQHHTKLQYECRADVVRLLPSRTQDRQPALVQHRSW